MKVGNFGTTAAQAGRQVSFGLASLGHFRSLTLTENNEPAFSSEDRISRRAHQSSIRSADTGSHGRLSISGGLAKGGQALGNATAAVQAADAAAAAAALGHV